MMTDTTDTKLDTAVDMLLAAEDERDVLDAMVDVLCRWGATVDDGPWTYANDPHTTEGRSAMLRAWAREQVAR
jgi:hypothetical protein